VAHQLGVQLIVFGDKPNTDLDGVLRAVAAAGYAGAETGPLHQVMEADFIRDTFAAHSLQLTGIHCGFDDFNDPSLLEQHIEFLKSMNAPYLICSGVGQRDTIQAYEAAAERFNEVGELCASNGLTFCYHNHWFEFDSFNGIKGIDRLCQLTDPGLVKLCIDVYWVAMGGEDPADFIHRHADRAGYYHFKDGGKHGDEQWWWVELGQGEIDLPAAWDAARQVGCDWVIAEQDRSDKDPALSVKESFDYLKAIGV